LLLGDGERGLRQQQYSLDDPNIGLQMFYSAMALCGQAVKTPMTLNFCNQLHKAFASWATIQIQESHSAERGSIGPLSLQSGRLSQNRLSDIPCHGL
jgi:hypothetical protein